MCNHNEHSPPEAAIEATPETTPIRVNILLIIIHLTHEQHRNLS